MSEQEIRIELAKLAGWERINKSHWGWEKRDGTLARDEDIPPITLDWLHQIIMDRLTEAQRKALRFQLYRICSQMFAHCANKMQMAEAILTVIGKWK